MYGKKKCQGCARAVPLSESWCYECSQKINETFAIAAVRIEQAGAFGFRRTNRHEQAAQRRAVKNKNYGSGIA